MTANYRDDSDAKICEICKMKLCPHGFHPDDECYQCELEAKSEAQGKEPRK